MRELYVMGLRYLRKVWLYRHVVLVVVFVAAMAGWAGVSQIPNVYRADTRLYVDTKSMLSQLLEGVALDSSQVDQEFLRVARRSLLSRPNLERVARETDLDITATTPKEHDRMIERLRRDVGIESASTSRKDRENLFRLTYESADKQRALNVVRALHDVFIESVLGFTRRDNEKMQRFLDDKIAEYEQNLDQAEARLKRFKENNTGLLPQEGKNYFSMLQTMREKVRQAELELKQAQRIRDGLKQQLELARQGRSGEMKASEGSGSVARLDTARAKKIRRLERRLASLKLRYTGKHPDVIAAERQLEQARSGNAVPSAASGSGSGDGAAESIVLQELRVELGKAEAEVASARASLEEYRQRAQQLDEAVDTIPRVEAELQRLTRDYDIYKQQYEELVRRRESAEMSQEADLMSDEGLFQVIEPPHVSAVPVAPNRAQLISAVFGGALFAGVGVGVLLAQIRPSFSDLRELREVTGRPVLGRVGEVRSKRQALSRSMSYLLFVGVVLLLVLMYAWLMLSYGLQDNPF